jgi:hypothetical protein
MKQIPVQPDFWQRRPALRAPPPIERRLHCSIVDLLAVAAAPEVWFSHLPAGEYRTPETARLLQRMGLQKGLPDLMLLDRSGIAFLELKRSGAKPTPEQAAFLERCRKAGIRCAVADSFDAAVAVLRDWGVLSDRVKV